MDVVMDALAADMGPKSQVLTQVVRLRSLVPSLLKVLFVGQRGALVRG